MSHRELCFFWVVLWKNKIVTCCKISSGCFRFSQGSWEACISLWGPVRRWSHIMSSMPMTLVMWCFGSRPSWLVCHKLHLIRANIIGKHLCLKVNAVWITGWTKQTNSSSTQWPFQQYYILLSSIKPWPLVGELLFYPQVIGFIMIWQ